MRSSAWESGHLHHAWLISGPEGVGKATTRAVVQAITAIIVTDMLFAFMATR